MGLTPQEVEGDRFDWDPRRPYALQKNRQGCVHLQGGGCACSIYNNRPRICQTYSCEKDSRIWADFENMVINPDLKKRLDTLDVATIAPYSTTPASENRTSASSPSDEIENSNGHAQKHNPELSELLSQPSKDDGKTATASDGQQTKGKVGPPNFDDLRELMVPLPEKKFSPSSEDGKET